jgi:hypothetical protein
VYESFLKYRNFLYLYVALALVTLSLLTYALHDPLHEPNGGTWLGYTLGGLSAALVLWLTALGIRKRAYNSTLGTVRGWVSAHVYLGLALVVLATLHSGFQFGWNIHTLAWALMLVVVLSGIYGIWAYNRYPVRITRNRANLNRDLILTEISEIDQKADRAAEALGSPVDRMVISAHRRFTVGGGLLTLLTGRDRSCMEAPRERKKGWTWKVVLNPDQQRLLELLNRELAGTRGQEEYARLQGLIDLISQKRSLAYRLREDIRMQSLMRVWLYLHIPLTFMLLAALTAHIVSVFIYW